MDFENGDRVTALRDIIDGETGDHPAFLLARKGDVLVVNDAAFETKYEWVVRRADGGSLFSVRSEEISHLPNARLDRQEEAK